MIKPVDEIPKNLAQKRESYREQIRKDIQEALDKGIRKFEFVGDYKYKYLAKYAREEADKMIRAEYILTVLKHQEELENVRCNYYMIREKIRFITVTAVRGEDKEKPRVFCEIADRNPEDIIMESVLENDRERKEMDRIDDEVRKEMGIE